MLAQSSTAKLLQARLGGPAAKLAATAGFAMSSGEESAPPPSRPPRELASVLPVVATAANDVFFKSSELDEQPRPLVEVNAVYPAHARAGDIEGSLHLFLLIDEAGVLRHVEVLDASPPGVFESAAVSAFRGVAFAPGRRGNAAVKSRMMIKMDFALD